jgi:hypothetical protein
MKTKTTNSYRTAAVLIASVLTGGAAFTLAPAALAAGTAATSAAATAPLPAEKKYEGIAYVTGGVGEGQAKAFEEALKNYPLAIEIVQKQRDSKVDEFTAYADVKIMDHAGKEIFKAKAEGPFVLVRLDPGKYSMTVSYQKHTLHRNKFTVAKGKTTRETFVFPVGS